ncbi:MAG: hypothetical protein U9R38_06660 [Candidatus Margulisiibacteriota bacterium]|nr:hypothetical protein [Candidatus Margulisiibacteriota bacterium]
MRKTILFVLLLLVPFLATALLFGCGQSTSTTTTTTLPSVSTDTVNKSKAGAFFASSGNSMAGMASDSKVSVSSASVSSIRAASSGPPSSFYNTLTDVNGYVSVQGFHSSESVSVRYITEGGTPVTPSYLASKAIAILGNFDWDTILTGAEPTAGQISSFISNLTYATAESLADYLIWSNVAGDVENGVRMDPTVNAALGSNHFTNPTPEASDLAGMMEGVVVISGGYATGNMSMNISLTSDANQYAVPNGATGSGTLEVNSVTLDATMEVTFTSEGSNESLSITGTTNDNNTVSINCVADGSGTGTIKDSNGTAIATMEITTAGQVTVTDSQGSQSTYDL